MQLNWCQFRSPRVVQVCVLFLDFCKLMSLITWPVLSQKSVSIWPVWLLLASDPTMFRCDISPTILSSSLLWWFLSQLFIVFKNFFDYTTEFFHSDIGMCSCTIKTLTGFTSNLRAIFLWFHITCLTTIHAIVTRVQPVHLQSKISCNCHLLFKLVLYWQLEETLRLSTPPAGNSPICLLIQDSYTAFRWVISEENRM